MKKKKLLIISCFLIISILLELFTFNYSYFNSKNCSELSCDITYGDFTNQEDKYNYSGTKYAEIDNINENVKYISISLENKSENADNENYIIPVRVFAIDDGNSQYYKLTEVNVAVSQKEAFKIHTYGKVQKLLFVIQDDYVTSRSFDLNFKNITLNEPVDFEFNIVRVLFYFIVFIFAYAFVLYVKNDSKTLCVNRATKKQRFFIIYTFTLIFIIMLLLIVENSAYFSVTAIFDKEYSLLAKSILKGRADIDVENGYLIKQLKNPYDPYERINYLKKFNADIWDVAYFNEKFYVYFGIVPVLLFYIPYYLITGLDLNNAVLVLILAVLLAVQIFRTLSTLIKTYFNNITFKAYLFLGALLTFATTISALLKPEIYYIPILTGLLFALEGINCWIKALNYFKESNSKKANIYLCLGSLFMALVAGCRPQLVLCSIFCIPIFFDILKQKIKKHSFDILSLILFALPYIIVAIGLMYYNYIRFGSVIDFGANYNLTTNDMTKRGFDLARLPSGLFAYFIQLPNISFKFPYINKVNFVSNYNGLIIKEKLFGNIFFIHIFLFIMLKSKKSIKRLTDKGILSFVIISPILAIIIASIDIIFAGIVMRYVTDFVLLLYIPAVLVFLQMLEDAKDKKQSKKLLTFLSICLVWTFIYSYLIAIQDGNLNYYCPTLYYYLSQILY